MAHVQTHEHEEDYRVQEVSQAIATIQAKILALVFALMGGTGLFAMTAWLVIKGGPEVGKHLGLLGVYFIGYTVTWSGSIIGFCYGALLGGIIGWSIGKVYNLIVGLRFP